ncbi:hypothetical protein C2142_38855 [Streptomyces sp. CB01881]|nr:hypothetical protein C2142_38855 [Streptomyces sp. CB01881]
MFRTANDRCRQVLTPADGLLPDPRRVYAPYVTAHELREALSSPSGRVRALPLRSGPDIV